MSPFVKIVGTTLFQNKVKNSSVKKNVLRPKKKKKVKFRYDLLSQVH